MDWYVSYTNRLYSIHTVCIQTASLWIHTHSKLYRQVQTNTNQYIVNGLVCIESPIQNQHLYRLKQASIQTCINQNSSIHTNTSWIDWYVVGAPALSCIRWPALSGIVWMYESTQRGRATCRLIPKRSCTDEHDAVLDTSRQLRYSDHN